MSHLRLCVIERPPQQTQSGPRIPPQRRVFQHFRQGREGPVREAARACLVCESTQSRDPPAASGLRQTSRGPRFRRTARSDGVSRARSADAGTVGRWRFRPATAAARQADATATAASASGPPAQSDAGEHLVSNCPSGPAKGWPLRSSSRPGGSPMIRVVLAGSPSANTRLLAVSRRAHPSKLGEGRAQLLQRGSLAAAAARARSPGGALGGSAWRRRRLGAGRGAAWHRCGRRRSMGSARAPHRRPIRPGGATKRERHPSRAARKRSRSR